MGYLGTQNNPEEPRKPDTDIDIKEKINKKEIEFKETIKPFVGKYGKDVCNNFFMYWTEPNKSKTKLRYEMEKTWDVKRRLANWANRDKTFNAKSNKPIAEPNYQKIITICRHHTTPKPKKATIGALLLEKTAIYEVMDFLKPEMFYDKDLDEIYSVILEVEEQSNVDLITVFEGLKKRNSQVDISLLADLSGYVNTAIHVKTHAFIVFQDYMRRMFVIKCSKSLSDSNDLSVDVDDLINDHIFEVENLSDVSDVGTTVSIDKLTTEAYKAYQEREKSQRR